MTITRPPGPRTWFGFGEMAKMRADLLGYHENLQRTYGDMVAQRIGPYWMYNLYHPEHIRELLVTHARKFHKFERVRDVFRQWNGDSMLIVEDDAWLRQRRMAQPAFAAKRMGGYSQVMSQFAKELSDVWLAKATKEIEVTSEITSLTLRIIAKTLFDADVSGSTSDLGRAVAMLSEVALHELEAMVSLPDWLPIKSKRDKRWAMNVLDDTIWSFVRERRASGEDHGDLLSMLLQTTDEDGGPQLTDVEVRNESMTLFIAGHDTSAAGLAWTLYLLAKHPQIQEQARAEVHGACSHGSLPTFEDLTKLSYIEHIVKESLRLYPPAIGVFMRKATQDVEIAGYTLPRGSLVQPISWITHRDERWFPNPSQFEPDRWSAQRASTIPPGAWYPFGMGPRVCIGQSFAMMEMVLVVATLMQRLRFTLPADHQEPQLQVHMSLRPRGGLKLQLESV